jgi:hypothetical protein
MYVSPETQQEILERLRKLIEKEIGVYTYKHEHAFLVEIWWDAGAKKPCWRLVLDVITEDGRSHPLAQMKSASLPDVWGKCRNRMWRRICQEEWPELPVSQLDRAEEEAGQLPLAVVADLPTEET